MNLMEAILHEIDRVNELIKIYESLPNNAGAFGVMLFKAEIDVAKKAIADNDTTGIIKAYQSLKEIK